MLVKSASPGAVRAALIAAILAHALAGCAGRPPRPQPPASPAAASQSSGAARAAPVRQMLDSATAMLGQPYRFGGASPGGFDCSGLVTFAARSAGLSLPRTAAEQLRSGVRVARDRLTGGDLVFMRLKHKDLHVGIALDGDRFIHAPATGGRVRIDSLSAQPYAAGFVEARRVTGAEDRFSRAEGLEAEGLK